VKSRTVPSQCYTVLQRVHRVSESTFLESYDSALLQRLKDSTKFHPRCYL